MSKTKLSKKEKQDARVLELSRKGNRSAPSLPATAPTYQERTDAGTKSVMRQSIERGLKDFDDGLKRVNTAGAEMVAGVNQIREAGREFNDARDLNQPEFRNWQHGVDDWKEEQLRREKMNCALKVFQAMPQKAKRLSDCPKALQTVLEFAQLSIRVKKLGRGAAEHEASNPWATLTSRVSDFETLIGELTSERPMERWEPDELEKFVRTTEPIVKEHETAKMFLAIDGLR